MPLRTDRWLMASGGWLLWYLPLFLSGIANTETSITPIVATGENSIMCIDDSGADAQVVVNYIRENPN